MGRRSGWLGLWIGLMCLGAASAASASGTEDILRKLDELTAVIQQQQKEIDRLKQELQRQKAQIQAVEQHGGGQAAVPVPDAQAKADTKAAAKAAAKKANENWTDRITLSGDLRLRYEGIYDRDKQLADGSTTSIPNRERFRFRARLAADAKVSDEISAHLMVGTNDDSTQDATTSNQTFTGDFNDKGIYIYRAYATYNPDWLKGLEVGGGKFRNNFLHTDIMWDPDVNPEGAYERYQYGGNAAFRPFAHLAQTVLTERPLESDDASLFIYQGGFDWRIGPVKWTLAGSWYDWKNLQSTVYLHNALARGGGGNTFVKDAGGTLQYAYDYRLAEVISFVQFKLGPLPTRLIFDYIWNTADDVPTGHDTAYYVGFGLGNEKERGDWSLNYKYARIEKDAVIGSMNDQDFYGANRKGHKVFLTYVLLKDVKFRATYFYTDPIIAWDPKSPTWAADQFRGHEDRLQVDFILQF